MAIFLPFKGFFFGGASPAIPTLSTGFLDGFFAGFVAGRFFAAMVKAS